MLDPATSSVLSQPIPVATQRLANQATGEAIQDAMKRQGPGKARSTCCGALIMPQRYKPPASCHCKATQAPCRRRDTSMPNGQGAARQHTPQPLQTSPHAGLSGACG